MKWKTKYYLCLIPSLLGVLIFYILPFIRVLYYSVLNNQFEMKFIGFENYLNTITNSYFKLALKNSFSLILICVPIVIIFAIFLSIIINKLNNIGRILSSLFIIPIVIPTAAIVSVWHNLFDNVDSAIVIYLLFIWKNLGICIILISAAVNAVPKQIYEAAELDGAGNIKEHLYITLPCIFPSILFSILLMIVYSFKIYKESYLYYGTNYPPEHSYTLQYYMDNHFMKLDYQALSSGAVINTIIILFIVVIMLKIQRKYTL